MKRFKCPECGCTHVLERVHCDGIVQEVHVYGASLRTDPIVEYDDPEAWGDVVDVAYECRDCDFTVPGVGSPEELWAWIQENCPDE